MVPAEVGVHPLCFNRQIAHNGEDGDGVSELKSHDGRDRHDGIVSPHSVCRKGSKITLSGEKCIMWERKVNEVEKSIL